MKRGHQARRASRPARVATGAALVLESRQLLAAPTISLSNQITSLSEDTDTTIAIKVADVDVTEDIPGASTLSLSGADAGLFSIVGAELFLQAGVALDFETNSALDVTIEIDDPAEAGSPDDTDALSIAITDANDAPMIGDQILPSILEDSPNGTSVGFVNATDADAGDALSYAITGGSGQTAFAINSVTGEITVADSLQLDFETMPSFTLQVTVTDLGGATVPLWIAQDASPTEFGQVEGMAGQNNPVIGAIHTVVAHPTDPDVLYVGGVNGGLWKTTNATSPGGPTWTPVADQLGSLSIGAMAFDPADSTGNTVVAASGRFSSLAREGGALIGVMRTTDGGLNWVASTGGGLLDGVNLSGIVANGNTIVVSSNSLSGVFRSSNGGATFASVSVGDGSATGLPRGVAYDIVQDPNAPDTLYTSIWRADLFGGVSGIYKSVDGGANWTKVSDTAIDAFLSAATPLSNLEMAVGNSGEVYAAMIVQGGLNPGQGGLFRTGDGGTTWTQLDTPVTNEATGDVGMNPRGIKGPGDEDGNGTIDAGEAAGIAGGQGAIHFSIVADPADPNIVYVGGDRQPAGFQDSTGFPNALGANNFTGRLFRVNAALAAGTQASSLTHLIGVSTISNSAPHADSREMVFTADGTLLETDDGGIYRRSNPQGLGDWFSMMGNLQVTEYHSLQYDANTNTLIGGTQDTGTPEQRLDGTWVEVSQGDGGTVAVDDSNPAFSIRYSSFQNLGAFRRRTINSVTGGVTNTAFPALTVTGGGPAMTPRFYTALELNTIDPARLVFGAANGVYESFDRGDTISFVGGPGGDFIFGTALAYGGMLGGVPNPDVLYIGDDSNQLLLRTSVGGALAPLTSYPGQQVNDIVLNPDNWLEVFAVDNNQVFFSNNGGGNWFDITGFLPTGGLRTIEYIPRPAGASSIVVGGLLGVFESPISGLGIWTEMANNLPNAPARDLDYDPVDNVLSVGTMGRGAWIFGQGNPGNPLDATATVAVNLLDGNDAPFAPNQTLVLFPGDHVDNALLGQYAASDANSGQSVTYSIVGGTGQGIFSINAATGRVRVADASQLLTDTSFTLSVLVADNGAPQLTDTATVTIDRVSLFFGARTSNGLELHRSAGGASGTVLVRNANGSKSSNPASIVWGNDEVFFTAFNNGQRELWISDGTAAGTKVLKNLGGAANSQVNNLVWVGNTLFFTATVGGQRELWKTNGTAAGTLLVKNLNGGSGSNPSHLVRVGTRLYFTARHNGQRELWKSDGTAAGTALVRNLNGAASSNPAQLAPAGGNLYFTALVNGQRELWKTNGTATGTAQVANINGVKSSHPGELTWAGGQLYFTATQGTERELWKTNGTAAGTARVKNLNGPNSSNPTDLTFANGTLFFVSTEVGQRELWKSDGTEGGTVRVKEINGTTSSEPRELLYANGTLYFTAQSGNQRELWTSDGTAAGTQRLVDLNGGLSANPQQLVYSVDRLFFVASEGGERELFASTGSAAGTGLVRNLNGALSATPKVLSGFAPPAGAPAAPAADDALAGQVIVPRFASTDGDARESAATWADWLRKHVRRRGGSR